jgi:multisubunit Na+/H+ antiporter MnhG subunit
VFRRLTGFLLAAIPLLVAIGLLRAVALLRRGTGASWRDAFGAFLIWQSTMLTVTSASIQGLFAKEAAFLRTPKTHAEPRFSDAVKANWAECLLGLLGLGGIIGAAATTSSTGLLVAGLLSWPTGSFLAAPYNSLSAQHAALPADLKERRRTEYRRYGKRRLTFAIGGLGLAGSAAAVALGLFVPGAANVTPPQIIGPARGQPVHYGSTTPSSPAPSESHHKQPGSHPNTTTTTTPTTGTTTTTTPTSTSPTTTTTPTTTTGTTTTPTSTSPTTATTPTTP